MARCFPQDTVPRQRLRATLQPPTEKITATFTSEAGDNPPAKTCICICPLADTDWEDGESRSELNAVGDSLPTSGTTGKGGPSPPLHGAFAVELGPTQTSGQAGQFDSTNQRVERFSTAVSTDEQSANLGTDMAYRRPSRSAALCERRRGTVNILQACFPSGIHSSSVTPASSLADSASAGSLRTVRVLVI
jgi:hypothetical protein